MNQTLRNLLIYTFAGFSFFIFAHVGFNLWNYGICRSVGYPIHINFMHTHAYCVDIAEYTKAGGWEGIYHYSWLFLMIVFPLIGYFLVRKRKTELSFWNWLGLFMLIVPLYRCVQTFAERIFYALIDDHKDVVSSVSIVLAPKFIIICILSFLIATYTYFKLLYKKERILLLLVSFPVYVVTYYSWFYVWGGYFMHYLSLNG